MNFEKAIKLINNLNADAIFLENEANMHYFTGFSPSEGAVIITADGDAYHLVDSRYTVAANEHAKKSGICVLEIGMNRFETVSDILKKHDVKSLIFEDESISYKRFVSLSNLKNVMLVPLSDKLIRIRNIKEPFEVELIKKANEIAEKSFTEILNHICIGKTEKELAAELDYLMAKNKSDGISFDTIVLSGTRSAMPHGVPSDREIKNGDFVLFDFGATYQGYHSDMTRTLAVGYATDEMKTLYSLVLSSQNEGIRAFLCGTSCKDVYYSAFDMLETMDMGKFFRHSLGHGIGLEIHEGYSISPNSENMLESGIVSSIEPGIYIPNKFGIRIEDMLYLSHNGKENLSNITKELLVL